MDKPIQMAIGVGLAIAAMAIVGVYVFGVIGGSTVSTDIVPKTLDAISSNKGKSLQISVSLTNQGSGSISSVASVLRVDVNDICKVAADGDIKACSDKTSTGSSETIYFPFSYDDTNVIDSFGTINIRGNIETVDVNKAVSTGYGCSVALGNAKGDAMKLSSQAGLNSLENAIKVFDADGQKIYKEPSNGDSNNVNGKGDDVKVGIKNVLCARNLGVFAGEEITLTVIAETTSGDTIERIIPLTVR